MCVILKTSCLYSFTINSQSKPKKISTLFVRYFPRETLYGLFELEIPESSQELFCLKLLFGLNFFRKLSSALLKIEIKNLLKKDASHLKIA